MSPQEINLNLKVLEFLSLNTGKEVDLAQFPEPVAQSLQVLDLSLLSHSYTHTFTHVHTMSPGRLLSLFIQLCVWYFCGATT